MEENQLLKSGWRRRKGNMGFENFLEEYKDGSDNGGYYGWHKYNPKLKEWVEELEPKFPGGIDLQYIEVSPQLTRAFAKAYNKPGETPYIRVAERVFPKYSDEQVKRMVAHEMAHVWMYNRGYDYSDEDRVFNWVLGRVDADITYCEPGDEQYMIIEEFIEHEKRMEAQDHKHMDFEEVLDQ